MNMLDRVANELRALASPGTANVSWTAITDDNRDYWRSEASKVIRSMTEPDDAMVDAGSQCVDLSDDWERVDVAEIWTAMIRAAAEGK